jgi:hypothetical protein
LRARWQNAQPQQMKQRQNLRQLMKRQRLMQRAQPMALVLLLQCRRRR